MDWFKVMSNYPDDPRIQKVGERGEVLFMRGMAYCATADSDGFIPETQLNRFGLPRVTVRVAALVMIGLWDTDEVDGIAGYRIRNWRTIQSEAYAAERKRIKDRNRAAALRAQTLDHDSTVVRQSYESRTTIAPLEQKRRTTPQPPAPQGGHDGTHKDCRTCRTSRRERAKAAKTWRPAWCGECNETTRLVGYDGPSPARCPDCHPLLNPLADEPESA